MKRIFLILFSYFFMMTGVLAGPPVVSVKSADSTKLPAKWTINFPNSAVTNKGGIEAFVSTDSNNLVKDRDFQAPSITTNWFSDVTLAKDTSIFVGNGTSAKATTTSQANGTTDSLLSQNVAIPTGYDTTGSNMEATAWVRTSLATTVRLCVSWATASSSCPISAVVIADAINRKYSVSFPGVVGATYYTISVQSGNQLGSAQAGVTYISNPFLGLTRIIGAGVPPMVFSAKSNVGVVSDLAGSSNWISNCTNPAVGQYVCPLNNFAVAPNCVTTAFGNDVFTHVHATSATSVEVRVQVASGAPINGQFRIICQKAGTDFVQNTITPNNYNYDWTPYTPTFTGLGTVSPSTNQCNHKRSGGDLIVACSFTAGTATATLFSMTLPGTLALDPTRIVAANTTAAAGQAVGTMAGNAANIYASIVTATGTSTTLLYVGNNTVGGSTLQPIAGNGAFISSILHSINFRVPILGWGETLNAPQLLGSVTSNATGALKLEAASVTSASPGVATNVGGSGFISGTCTRSGTSSSIATCTFGTAFAAAPVCTAISTDSQRVASISSTTASAVAVITQDSVGTLAAYAFNIMCLGVR